MSDLDPLNAGLVKALDLGIADSRDLAVLRTSLSAWLTLALDGAFAGPSDADLLALRDWVDGGLVGDMPEPVGYTPEPEPLDPTLADRTAMSIRVFWETKDWSASRFRAALVDARLHAR